MRHTITLSLLVLLIIPATLWAEDLLTSIPMPDPRISESTLITGTGWFGRGTRNESLACDLAQGRAIQQIKKGIALSRSKGWITGEELSRAVPVMTQERYWDAENGRCIVQMKLAVPSLEKPRKPGIPIVEGRQF